MQKTSRRFLIRLSIFLAGLFLALFVCVEVVVPAYIKHSLVNAGREATEIEFHVDKVEVSWAGELLLKEVTMKGQENEMHVGQIILEWSGEKKEKLLGRAIIKNVKFRPILDSAAFALSKPHEEDWISMKSQQLELDGIDLTALFKKQLFKIRHVAVSQMIIRVYRDKTRPPMPYKVKLLPVSLLKSLPFRVRIQKLEVHEGFIQYSEKTKKHLGKVWFEDINASITNFTNDSLTIKEHPDMILTYHSKLLGKIPMEAEITHKLASHDDSFRLKGKIAPFKAEELDPALYKLVGIEFSRGEFKRFEFEIVGNDEKAEGKLETEYEKLKIEAFTLHKDQEMKKSFLKSLAANLLVKENNIKGKKNYKTGTMTFDRRKDRFIFNYLWNVVKISMADVMVL